VAGWPRAALMRRVIGTIVPVALAAVSLSACGSSSDSGASELARQHELAQARSQAAQDARQSAHIKELEQRLKSVARQNHDANSAPSGSGSSAQDIEDESSSSDQWPGGSGFTVILASLGSQAEANSTQAEATDRGLDAGILYSSNFSSLRPGYWVVFSGVFPSASGAAARASRAHELGYTDAYPRFVAP